MFEVLLSNLTLICILVLMYLGSVGINIVLGLHHNLNDLKEQFSKEKLINGLIRSGVILVGAIGITVLVSLLPEVAAAFGLVTETNLFESISIVTIGGVMASTIVHYLKDALNKLYAILNVKKDSLPEKTE